MYTRSIKIIHLKCNIFIVIHKSLRVSHLSQSGDDLLILYTNLNGCMKYLDIKYNIFG